MIKLCCKKIEDAIKEKYISTSGFTPMVELSDERDYNIFPLNFSIRGEPSESDFDDMVDSIEISFCPFCGKEL